MTRADILAAAEVPLDEVIERFQLPSTHVGDIALKTSADYLPCGFPSIHHYGLLRQKEDDLVVVGARPGVGKTSLIAQIALNVAQHSNVLLYSVEMSKEQLKRRFVALESEKPANKLWLDVNQKAVKAAVAKLKTAHLRLDDTAGITIDELSARTLSYHASHPLSLVVVDYLQIVRTSVRGRSKSEEVLEVMEKLKTLAKLLSCPILAAAQLNREFNKRVAENPEAEPLLSDFADSSGVEKWGDIAMVMHRPHADRVKVFTLKNRHGEAKHFDLKFAGSIIKFYDEGVSHAF